MCVGERQPCVCRQRCVHAHPGCCRPMPPSACSVTSRRLTSRRRSDGDLLCAGVMSQLSSSCRTVASLKSAVDYRCGDVAKPVQIANCDSTVLSESDTHVISAALTSAGSPVKHSQCPSPADNVEPDSTTLPSDEGGGEFVDEIALTTRIHSGLVATGSDSGCCSVSDDSPAQLDLLVDSPSTAVDVATANCDDTTSLSDQRSAVQYPDDTRCASPPPVSVRSSLRFPVPSSPASTAGSSASTSTSSGLLCEWHECGCQFDSSSDLLSHLLDVHVLYQNRQRRSSKDSGQDGSAEECRPRCLWRGCKVYGRSGSANWLQRHAHTHTGRRPYCCIVNGCQQRFSTQLMLERHVNSHFTASSPVKRPAAESAVVKQHRRSRRSINQHQHPFSARIFDFFDASVMQRLQYQLVNLESSQMHQTSSSFSIKLNAQVLARRFIKGSTDAEVLVSWLPADIVNDSWVLESQFRPTMVLSKQDSYCAGLETTGRPACKMPRKYCSSTLPSMSIDPHR